MHLTVDAGIFAVPSFKPLVQRNRRQGGKNKERKPSTLSDG